jgi:hypothetical protein
MRWKTHALSKQCYQVSEMRVSFWIDSQANVIPLVEEIEERFKGTYKLNFKNMTSEIIRKRDAPEMKRHTFYVDDGGIGNNGSRYAAYYLTSVPNVSGAIGHAIEATLTCYSN